MIVDDFESIAHNHDKLFGGPMTEDRKRSWRDFFRPSAEPQPDVVDFVDGMPVYESVEFTDEEIQNLLAAFSLRFCLTLIRPVD